MGSKQAIPVALFAGGLPYVGAGAGNVGPLNGADYVHVVVSDGAGGWNSRVTTLADLIAQVPASGISQAFADGRYLRRDQELADLLDFVAARNDLNVYSKAEVNAAISAAVAGIPTGSPFESTPTKPTTANFTLQNGAPNGPTTISNTSKGVLMIQTVAAGAGVAQVRFAKANAYVAHANFDLRFRMNAISPQQGGAAQQQSLIICRNATSGRIQTWGDGNAGNQFRMDIFNNYSSGSAGSNAFGVAPQPWPWRRLTFDGTTFVWYMSPDGENWGDVFSYTLAAWLGICDEIGWGMVAANTSTAQGGVITHYSLT